MPYKKFSMLNALYNRKYRNEQTFQVSRFNSLKYWIYGHKVLVREYTVWNEPLESSNYLDYKVSKYKI